MSETSVCENRPGVHMLNGDYYDTAECPEGAYVWLPLPKLCNSQGDRLGWVYGWADGKIDVILKGVSWNEATAKLESL